MNQKPTYGILALFFCLTILCSCAEKVLINPDGSLAKYKLPNVDLSHWKVTLPVGDSKPLEVDPPQILAYATDETLQPYMYNDSIDGSLVFYAFPGGVTTQNSSYPRTELREQMVPGNNSVNWTFAQGGRMKGQLAVSEVTKDQEGKYHKVIVMQIHGRLSNEQRDLLGRDDNDAPPILKIYWQDRKVRVKTKVLENLNANANEILQKDAWIDDKGHTFSQDVGFGKFTLEVIVSEGRLEVVLNGYERIVYGSDHIEKWGVFENYFKAGNYFQTNDHGAKAIVKYYSLEVSHNSDK
ncbi:polysaccharide lyase family 7 protein [uncultured Roseivirga sp.]|uniref:polysaccharide lyase family 7 protein n=1 Tax=uncultured Roseivirga sp. TaxID=543088 RepID=UPI0030D9E07A